MGKIEKFTYKPEGKEEAWEKSLAKSPKNQEGDKF